MSWETEDGVDVDLNVSGVKLPTVPACRTGHPDSWSAAYDAGFDKIEVRNMRGARMPESVERELKNSEEFLNALEAEL